MSDEHGGKIQARRRAEKAADEHEHQHERDTGDDIGVHHGDVRHGVHRSAKRAIAQLVYPDCGSGAHDGGDKGSGGREDKGVAHGTEGLRIAEELTVPVEREAGEHGKALRLVEGEHEQDRDRREEEDHNDRGIYLCGRFHFAPLLTRL